MLKEFEFGVQVRVFNYSLKALRVARGLTVKQLAGGVGVSSKTIYKIQSFKEYPRPALAEKIALALRVSPSLLFPEELRNLRRVRGPETMRIPLTEARRLGMVNPLALLTTPEEAEDRAYLGNLKEDIAQALSTLRDKERRVIELRFGLVDGLAKTQKEVAVHLGKASGRSISSSRVGQIEARALRKLRHVSRSKALKDHWV